jgi:dipeptidyl aminopeptidase/acylaminoacyl peptidase
VKPIVLCGLCLATLLAYAGDKRPMTPEDVLALKNAGAPQMSPDGKTVVYTLSSADLKDNKSRTEIWIVSTSGGKPRRFTSGKEDRAPQWSPDGQWIAFLSTRDGGNDSPKPQIYVISPFGGEAEKLTDSKTGAQSFTWSPDSKRIAYVAETPLSDAEEKKQKDKDDAQVIDGDFRFSRLWTIDVESKKTQEIVKGDFVIGDPQWSPDNARISYTTNPTSKPDDGSLSDIFIANADGSGTPHKLFENDGPDTGARWSPDGKWIAFNSRDTKNGVIGLQHLYVISPEGGTPRAAAPGFDGQASGVTWSRDSSTLYFQSIRQTTGQLFSVPAAGGAAKALSSESGVISSFSLAREGGKIALVRSDLEHPAEIYAGSFPNLDVTRLTDHNPQIRDMALGRGEVVQWKSKDGVVIEGVLIYPAGYTSGKRYPLIATIHGGPAGVWLQSFPGSWGNDAQVWAGKGWLVFEPNVRGSVGYGEKFELANVRDWGGGDYQDIQSGIDDLVKRGIADPDRLGQSGWSYGGYLTAWTLTQTNRFKAVMVGAGLTDMFSMYSTNDLQRTLESYFGATPWNDLEAYRRASAMTFIKQARTPTLILHGGADKRVPTGQSQELYMGLRKNNVPVQMVFFPREGHGLTEPRHQLDKMKREYAWFSKHVLGVEEKAEPEADKKEKVESTK